MDGVKELNFNLHLGNLGSNPGIMYGAQVLHGVPPKHSSEHF